MSKTKASKKQTAGAQTTQTSQRDPLYTAVALGVVLVLTVLAFLPFTQYFFAQDDFVLIYRAWAAPGAALAEFFGSAPGQFRPLTKVAYFAAMYAVFGLNALPFHIVSIIVHLLNVVLFFMLLRRFGVGRLAAVVTTQLFAAHLVFFHVIAWISCIQQLLALTFMLTALILGLDALRGTNGRARWLSFAAYLLALMCVEQTFGVPILLFIAAAFGLGLDKRPLSQSVRVLAPHLVAMVVYVFFMFVWKSAPEEGPYQTRLGSNVLLNLTTYSSWLFDFWTLLPAVMTRLVYVFTLSHVVVAIVIVYHLVRRRGGWVLFALAFFILALAPALLLVNHTFMLHLYVASFGMLLLVAMALNDVLNLPGLRRPAIAAVFVVLLMASAYVSSFARVRTNEHSVIAEAPGFRTSFVLRRAVLAQRVYENLMAKTDDIPAVRQVYFVYGRQEKQREAVWNAANFRAAIGRGHLVNLAYDKRDLLIHFKLVGDTVARFDRRISRFFVYGDFGKLLTYEEANASIGGDSTSTGD